MELEKSRNGFYTVTFLNKENLNEKEIHNLFKRAGRVCKIINSNQRIFVRFRNKHEAERAIVKFGNSHNVEMAKNNEKFSETQQSETQQSETQQSETGSVDTQTSCNKKKCSFPTLNNVIPNSNPNMNSLNTGFHLILGNLPKSYTVKDVRGLVEEAKPLSINELEETKVFHVKFCHIVLDSLESLSYLIKKLDGFLICSEKLMAVEARQLLEWRKTGL